jgi:mono/diheme cytochrome c family protein
MQIPQFSPKLPDIHDMKPSLPAFARHALASTILCASAAHAQDDFTSAHAGELLDQYCSECHNSEDWAGSVAFDLIDVGGVDQEPETWEHAVRKLRGRLMPPPGSEQPTQAEIDRFVGFLETSLDANVARPQAGHVPVQRLNRSEYAQVVRDLLAVDIDTAEYLPLDIEVDGFDNIAAALSTSPAFLDSYINLARSVARLAVGEPVPKQAFAFYRAPSAAQDTYQEGMPLGTRGGMQVTHQFPADGEYQISVLDLDVGLYPRSVETEHTLILLVDDEEVFRETIGGEEDFALANKGGAPAASEIMKRFAKIPVQVTAGPHRVSATFVERASVETDETIGGFVPYGGFAFEGELRVPRLLNGIEITGPHSSAGISLTPSRAKLFVCQPEAVEQEVACARQIISNLATRAYRRPATEEDIALLLPFYERGRATEGGFDAGIEQVVVAVLASPDFLYRGISPNKDIGDEPQFALTDQELATRLSFFIWGQGPDEVLLELAADGELSDDAVLAAQVQRMLADPRAQTLVNNFALRWLNLDDPLAVDVDPNLFPSFRAQLRLDFAEELRLFLGSVLLEDRPVTELLSANHTFLNDRLARHYGIETVFGAQFRRVELEDERRWGLLGKAAVLLRTSYGDRTSPVLRGAWVLEKLMGTPPTPPPPNVETDLSVPAGEKPTTVRARLEQHRSQPSCNQCHGVIDPIGLALENFTVTGQWRDVDVAAEAPIDARTVLPSGVAIEGPVELRNQLLARPEQFALALTEKLFMYALGRELEYFDLPQVRAIVRGAADAEYRLSALVTGIVQSPAFRMQALPEGSSEIAATTNTVAE